MTISSAHAMANNVLRYSILKIDTPTDRVITLFIKQYFQLDVKNKGILKSDHEKL